MGDKKRKRMHATVEKIIKPSAPEEPEKAQINIDSAEDLYREIRVDNVVQNDKGETASLKAGAKLEVIIEADSNATIKKPA